MLKPILMGSAAIVSSNAASALSAATAAARTAIRRNRLPTSVMCSSHDSCYSTLRTSDAAPRLLGDTDRRTELLDWRIGQVVDVVAQRFHGHPDHHVEQLRSGIALIEECPDVGVREPAALVDDLAHEAAQRLGPGVLQRHSGPD